MTSTVDRGRHAESLAAAFLCLRGYTIRDRNVRLGPLEIDLVAEHGDVLAVVEVKFREKPAMGGASGAVNPAKVRRLETAAVRYVRSRGIRGRKIRPGKRYRPQTPIVSMEVDMATTEDRADADELDLPIKERMERMGNFESSSLTRPTRCSRRFDPIPLSNDSSGPSAGSIWIIFSFGR